MKRIYIYNKLEKNLVYQLDSEQSAHLLRVVRLNINNQLVLFNNIDGEWLCSVDNIINKKLFVKALEKISNPIPIPNIDLFFSPIKYQNSETIIRQGTEIGVRNFYPTIFNRTVARKINLFKFNSYALSATQQSGRTQIPIVSKVLKINEHMAIMKNMNIMMFDENLDGIRVDQAKVDNKLDTAIIVGPEGGFEKKERELISSFSNNFYNLKLGSRILKADTAVISALSLVFHYFDHS